MAKEMNEQFLYFCAAITRNNKVIGMMEWLVNVFREPVAAGRPSRNI